MEVPDRQHVGTRPYLARVLRSPNAIIAFEHEFHIRDGYAIEAQVGTVYPD